MFHRRRASSNPRYSAPANPNPTAHSAATQAFLKNHDSNASLAAAAAGAALRSHTHSPVAVGQTQTKRMQRKDYQDRSSNALQRQNSSGSMTERTFRSPSPGRAGAADATTSDDVPPLPPLPRDQPTISKSQKRASSLEAPFRVSSPPPTAPGGRGVSLDRGTRSPVYPSSAGRTKLEQIQELERENSRRSVNFSRPLSPSPMNSPARPDSTPSGWFTQPVTSNQRPRQNVEITRPKTADGISRAEVSGIQTHLQEIADRPTNVKKRRKKKAPSPEGSHLKSGTLGLGVTGTALEAPETANGSVITPSENVSIIRDVQNEQTESTPAENPSPAVKPPAEQFQTRAASLLVPQQGPIPNESEAAKAVEQPNASRKVETPSKTVAADALVASSQVHEQANRSARLITDSAKQTEGEYQSNSDRLRRGESISPARKPHFSPTTVDLQNGAKHHPPPRSISPMKSALKHSPSSSTRTASPGATFQASFDNKAPSETSAADAEDAPKRKKGVRVSFEEAPAPALAGLEASKHAPAIENKTRRKTEDEFEDLMKPRPTLPSFGSIRGRKKQDEEPMRPVRGIPEQVPSSLESSATLVDLGSSRDHVIGGVLAEDFATKRTGAQVSQPAETESLKQSDILPLPPQVTSVEGTGYASDSESIYSDKVDAPVGLPETAGLESGERSDEANRPPVDQEEAKLPSFNQTGQVPSIAVLPATPAADEKEQEPVLLVPGAFPLSESSLSVHQQGSGEPDRTLTTTPRPTNPPVEEHIGPEKDKTTDQATPSTSLPVASAVHDDSDTSDNNSIYSDASEDWQEEDGTYASLDAIVKSPLERSVAGPPSGESSKASNQAGQIATSSSPTSAEWQASTAYWRSLSEQKKRALENRETRNAPQPSTSANLVPVERELKPRNAAAGGTPQPSIEKDRALRKSMRANLEQPKAQEEPRDPPRLRSSLRSSALPEPEDGHIMPSTLRNRGAPSGLAESRWAAPSQEPIVTGLATSKHAPKEPRGALQKKHIPPAVAPEPLAGAVLPPKPMKNKPVTMPMLQRADSDESNSSFKRSRRRPSTQQADTFNLRRTMRGPVTNGAERPKTPESRSKPNRFSWASGSRNDSTLAGTDDRRMRSSLRGSVDAGDRSLRSPKGKSSKLPGFGSRKNQKALSSPQPYHSRFAADSDDDLEDRSTPVAPAFQSRFVDSDDENDVPLPPSSSRLPASTQPIRGISSVLDDDAYSTDSEDGADLNVLRTRKRLYAPVVPSPKDIEAATNGRPKEGSALAAGTMRQEVNGNDLAASKHAPSASGAPERPKNHRRFSLPSFGRNKDKKRDTSVPPMPTFAAVERPGTSDSASMRRAPRLQRRSTPTYLPQVPEGKEESSWPLPAAPTINGDVQMRPVTSDGVPQGPRPGLGSRQTSAQSKSNVVYGRSGKKKRFPLLRRAFRLKD